MTEGIEMFPAKSIQWQNSVKMNFSQDFYKPGSLFSKCPLHPPISM